jgi:hypothetical protein
LLATSAIFFPSWDILNEEQIEAYAKTPDEAGINLDSLPFTSLGRTLCYQNRKFVGNQSYRRAKRITRLAVIWAKKPVEKM